ncbi:MAG: NAD+ synthase (glutamine-hydrolyzing) [Gammaproteobacteria bacterium]|jgi:NAD+ synthase (glutamine-hydrolysing)
MSRMPRIVLAQMEVRPGRPDLNVARMLQMMDEARGRGAEIIAFPELCVSGYILGDLWEQDAMVEDFASYSEDIRAASDSLIVLFGNVALDGGSTGEDGRQRKFNSVLVCQNGNYVSRSEQPAGLPVGCQPKILHPNYRFFDDDRHFYSLRKLAQAHGRDLRDYLQPFSVELVDGAPFCFGAQLCEDIWFQDYHYDNGVFDTLRTYCERGAQAVFNLSASPWTAQKNDKRDRVIGEALAQSPVPFFYVNQVGAQNNGKNILVFDGDSTAYAADGQVMAVAKSWCEALLDANFDNERIQVDEQAGPRASTATPAAMQNLLHGLVVGIRHLDHIRGGQSRYLIGVSGGVDSALVVALLCQAVGAERVFAVNMPTQFNSGLTRANAQHVCGALGVELLECPIQELYERLSSTVREASFTRLRGDYTRLVDENIQARIRGADILAGLSSKLGLVYTNNGNKTETALGYATLYGDVNGAVAPIADLYKTQVFELSSYLNEAIYRREVIPWNLLSGETVPSAELSAAQDVTKGLGDPIKYGYHDAMLRVFIEGRAHAIDVMTWFSQGRLFERLQWAESDIFLGWFADTEQWLDDLEWVTRLLRINYFKRIQAPPIIVLSKRAFGFDLRESQLPDYQPRGYQAARDALKACAIGDLVAAMNP